MIEQARREKIAGDPIRMLYVVVIISVGIVLSYFLIRGGAIIIDQLVSYFQQKELSAETAASVPTMYLNEKYLTSATNGLSELRWLVSSVEQESALAHKNLIFDNVYITEIQRYLPYPICFCYFTFFLALL